VDTNGHPVTRQTLLRAPTGYLGVWSDNMSAPHEAIMAAVIDDNLVAHAPVTIASTRFTARSSPLPRTCRVRTGTCSAGWRSRTET